jgi:hypothetical protein
MADDKTKNGGLWGARRAPLPTPQRPAAPLPAPDPNPRVLPLAVPEPGDRTYAAFAVREHAPRLNIRCARGPSRFPGYHYLLDIIFDYDFSAAFTLVYTFMVVEVTGQNLEPIAHAIAYGSCERIVEFHPRHHERPAAGEPMIEAIKIVAVGSGADPQG